MKMQRYGLAKAAVNCYSLELARRYKNDLEKLLNFFFV